MRKKAVLLVPVSAVLMVVLTLLLTFTPASLDAATRYSAGNETSGTHICNCPVTVGNCVCAYTDPQPKEPGVILAEN